jgi:cytochrome c-type biogenesis protein CcmH
MRLFSKRFASALLAALIVAAPAAWAVQPDEVMPDAGQELRARNLSREIRCMVCQNQSIDDSDAPLARDLRILVRERIGSGDSDAQVLDFLVARYGEFVLLKPRFELHTLLLWLVPPLVLGGGGIALWVRGRRRAARANSSSVQPLTPEEEARLARLLAEQDATEPDVPHGPAAGRA